MKAVIVSEMKGEFVKIVWIEECRGGIYMGFYGKANKMHYSYHQDGTVHMKSGSNYLPMYKTLPIQEIKSFVSITAYGITLEEGYEFALSKYNRSKDANSVIYINSEIIKRKKILNIIPYIVAKGAEKDCIRALQYSYASMKGQSFELLNANFFKLDKFPGFLVGILLSGGK